MPAVERTTAVYAVDTLNDLIGDFVSGVALLREYDAQVRAGKKSPLLMVTVQKICLFHLVLSLTKFTEFHERFHQVIPSEHRDVVKGLLRSINQKGVRDFRNKCVGHIWDNDQGRPLIHSEIMARSRPRAGRVQKGYR
jgi:hypothetical protein